MDRILHNILNINTIICVFFQIYLWEVVILILKLSNKYYNNLLQFLLSMDILNVSSIFLRS